MPSLVRRHGLLQMLPAVRFVFPTKLLPPKKPRGKNDESTHNHLHAPGAEWLPKWLESSDTARRATLGTRCWPLTPISSVAVNAVQTSEAPQLDCWTTDHQGHGLLETALQRAELLALRIHPSISDQVGHRTSLAMTLLATQRSKSPPQPCILANYATPKTRVLRFDIKKKKNRWLFLLKYSSFCVKYLISWLCNGITF